MKKIKLVLALILTLGVFGQVSTLSAAGQRGSFNQGDFLIGPSVGLGIGWGLSVPLAVNAEYGITKNIGIGAFVGYAGYSYSVLGYTYSWSIIPIGVTGMYHFDIGNPKIDIGVGAALGYNIWIFSGSLTGLGMGSASWLAWGVFGNFRYFVTNNIALKARLGYGISIAEVGVDFRL